MGLSQLSHACDAQESGGIKITCIFPYTENLIINQANLQDCSAFNCICRFDEFKLVRQAILLAIDTFGFSHLLPIFGLPLLVSQRHSINQKKETKLSLSAQLSQVS